MLAVGIFGTLVAVYVLAVYIAVKLVRGAVGKAGKQRDQSIFGLDRPPDPSSVAAPSWRTSRGGRPRMSGERRVDPDFQWAVDEFIREMEQRLRGKHDSGEEE